MAPHDWNAKDYDRTNAGIVALGREVLDRLELSGDETVLDAGCGSGALTEILVERLPDGAVIGLDASRQMVEYSRERLGDRAEVIQADLSDFDLGGRVVDAVFSTATFHWVKDHERLFSNLRAVTRDGGRLVAQCGGAGNIARVRAAAVEVAALDPYREHFHDPKAWNYAAAGETEARLIGAGYTRARCWLEPRPIHPDDPAKHLREVILGAHLEQLPVALREPFADAVHERAGDLSQLDYVRLNIEATA